MARAFLVKLVAALSIGVELWILPPRIGVAMAIATFAATALFFAWVIVSSRSQFLVESVHRLPAAIGESEDLVAFTFDDGPDPVTTPQVLALLARHRAKATFFVVGSRARKHPELVRRIVAEGHTVGSHTFDHSHTFHFMAPRRQREELERGIAAIAAVTGERPKLFRPPQGLRTPLLRDALRPLDGLVCVT